MINILDIKNFQGHKDSVLKFHERINVITGSSYTGKTSIIRALKWLINNKPIGDKFRSRWGGDTSVCIHFDNNYITRFKNNENGNGYVLNGKSFVAIGAEIPKEILDTLNMSDINIQYQLDSPFFISDSAGEMSKFLNKIIDLEKIDLSLSKVEQEKRKIIKEIEFLKNQIEKLEEQKLEYSFLKEMEKDIIELDSYVQIIIEYGNLRKTLFELIKKYNTITRKLEDQKKYNISIKDILIIERLWKEKEKIREERENLCSLLHRIKDMQDKIKINAVTVNQLQNEFDISMPDICPLCGR